jgi:hypothetical protein
VPIIGTGKDHPGRALSNECSKALQLPANPTLRLRFRTVG